MTKLTDIECEIVHKTPLAVLVWDGTHTKGPDGQVKRKQVWLPLSVTEINGDGTVTIPERLAIEKGLV